MNNNRRSVAALFVTLLMQAGCPSGSDPASDDADAGDGGRAGQGGSLQSGGAPPGTGGTTASGDGGDITLVSDAGLTGGTNGGALDAGSVDASSPVPMPPPARIVFFVTPYGTGSTEWRPRGSETDFVLSPAHAPLQVIKDKLLYVDGIGMAGRTVTPDLSTAYPQNSALLLTAFPSSTSGSAGGPSLDYVVGDCNSLSPFRGIHAGVQRSTTVSYQANGLPIAPENSPAVIVRRIDVRDVFVRPDLNPQAPQNYREVGAIQQDIVLAAFAQRRTCAATLMWGESIVMNWLGNTNSVHANGTFAYTPELMTSIEFARTQTWFAQQFASFVLKLAQTPEGSGNLLDSTLVVWVSEKGDALNFSNKIPVIIAGNVNQRFKNGRFVTVQNRTQADLLVSLASAFNKTSFGSPALNGTVIRELFAR